MNTVKTAISLDQELLTRAEELAQVLHLSRSELYSRALRTYLQHQENQVLLHRLNVAYMVLATGMKTTSASRSARGAPTPG